MADWNVEPQQLHDINWPGYIKSQVVTPNGVSFTCDQGRGRMLDYALVSHTLVPYFSLEPDLDSPWKPHLGLRATIRLEIKEAQARVMLKPRKLDTFQGPVRPWAGYLRQAKPTQPDFQQQYPVDSIAHSVELSQQYALFSRASELLICDQACLSGAIAEKHWGRGLPASFKVGPAQAPNRYTNYTLDPNSNYWAACHSRLYELLRHKLHHQGRAGASGHSSLLDWFARVSQTVSQHEDNGERARSISRGLAEIGSFSVAQISGVLVQVKASLEVAHRVFVAKRKRGFSQWLQEALKDGAGLVHKLATAGQRVDDPPDVVVENGQPVFEPLKVLEARASFWKQYWGSRMPDEQTDWIQEVRTVALQQQRDMPVEPIELCQVQEAIAGSPAKTGVGSDLWRVKQWHVLPDEAKQMLADIMNGVEDSLSFPVQALLNVIAMLGKSTGGERPICLTTSIYRCYSRIRKTWVSSWESERAGFWDAAVKNSTPLKAALIRELLNEVSINLKLSVAEILWDMEKFYDNINIPKLLQQALVMNFPKRTLYLSITIHLAPRVLAAQGGVSRPVHPYNSIIAGCTFSSEFGRPPRHPGREVCAAWVQRGR